MAVQSQAPEGEIEGGMSEGSRPVDVSIVSPVFNERENLTPLVDELLAVLRPTLVPFEIVLVDDGSQDGSAEAIDALAALHPEVRGVHFETNGGQTAAFDAGFKHARGAVVVTIDADLQNDPRDIPALLRALEGHDAAVGFRAERRDGMLRRLSSKIANAVRNRVSGDDIIDTGCSLKAFRADALREIKLWNGMHRFLPTLIRLEGRSVVQLPVNHRPRLRGTSKYGVWNRVFRSLADLFAVRWMKSRRLRYRVLPRTGTSDGA
jgi:glycosyltransferase involved in cell wall biosynthesis